MEIQPKTQPSNNHQPGNLGPFPTLYVRCNVSFTLAPLSSPFSPYRLRGLSLGLGKRMHLAEMGEEAVLRGKLLVANAALMRHGGLSSLRLHAVLIAITGTRDVYNSTWLQLNATA